MEARKSYNVLSASWRPRKTGHVTHLKSEELRVTGVHVGRNYVNSNWILKAQDP